MSASRAAATDLELPRTMANRSQPISDDFDTLASSSLSAGAAELSPGTVSSLRAAALSSMRSKRRKVVDKSQPVLVRPASTSRTESIPNTVLLDYGNEESSAFQQISDSSSTTTSRPREGDSSGDRLSVDNSDNNLREEGEISDEEGLQSSSKDSLKPQTDGHEHAYLKQERPPTPSIAGIAEAAQPFDSEHQVRATVQPLQPDTPAALKQGYTTIGSSLERLAIDENHVRPGLTSESF